MFFLQCGIVYFNYDWMIQSDKNVFCMKLNLGVFSCLFTLQAFFLHSASFPISVRTERTTVKDGWKIILSILE